MQFSGQTRAHIAFITTHLNGPIRLAENERSRYGSYYAHQNHTIDRERGEDSADAALRIIREAMGEDFARDISTMSRGI